MSILVGADVKRKSRPELWSVPIPKRGLNAGPNWIGINHGFMADTIVNRCIANGFTVEDEYWVSNPTGVKLVGAITLTGGGLDEYSDLKFQLGMSTANDGKEALRFVVGGTITICDNGILISECDTVKKHTVNFNLNETIDIALKEFVQISNTKTIEFINALKSFTVEDNDAYILMFYSYRKEIVPFRSLEYIYNQWHSPSYTEFAPRNAWSLYNAFTHSLKKSVLLSQYTAHIKLHDMFQKFIRARKRVE